MLGPLSSIITKIQGKAHHLDKVIGPEAADRHKSAEVETVKIRGGADTDDVLKKDGRGAHYESPFRSDCGELISDALGNAQASSDDAPTEKDRSHDKDHSEEIQKDSVPLPDSEKITNLSKIFKKTNKSLEKLKGENGYKGSQKSIKTNPNNKGNLIDRKTG